MNACTFPECPRPAYRHGLCYGHRVQKQRGVELRPLRPRAPDGSPVWLAKRQASKVPRPLVASSEEAGMTFAEPDNTPGCLRCGLRGEHECLPERATGFLRQVSE